MNIQDKINILSKYNEDCIVGGGGLRDLKNYVERRKAYYLLIGFLLSYFGAKGVLNRVSRDII